MNDSQSHAEHVAVVIERTWLEDMQRAIAWASQGELSKVNDTLERWWARREQRLGALLAPFSVSARDDICRALAQEPALLQALPPAGRSVRCVALADLQRVATRLAPLRALNAPDVVLEGQLLTCVEALRALEPESPWAGSPLPQLGVLVDPDTERELADLHALLGHMLRAAQAERANIGLGADFHGSSEAIRFLAVQGGPRSESQPANSQLAESSLCTVAWPGFELTTMSVDPDSSFWCSPRVTLPQRLEVPHPDGSARLLVMESSGPISYAVSADSDQLNALLAPSLAAAVQSLAADEALLSFVWLSTETAGPWRVF